MNLIVNLNSLSAMKLNNKLAPGSAQRSEIENGAIRAKTSEAWVGFGDRPDPTQTLLVFPILRYYPAQSAGKRGRPSRDKFKF